MGWYAEVAAGADLSRLRALLLDLDGVVYRGELLLPGAAALFSFLREQGLCSCLITNNSTQTAAGFAAKLNRLGIAVGKDEILTSAEATADYLSTTAGGRRRTLVVGGRGLREALRDAGFSTAGRRPDFVVVGLDVNLTYAKLRRATLAIRGGAGFIASNADPTMPTEEGEVPGAGAIVAALQVAGGVEPTVVGKPRPYMLELAMRRLGVSPAETAIVGDRLSTDILAGREVGLTTILVLTGVTRREEADQSPVKPDFVFADLQDLHAALTASRTPRQAEVTKRDGE